MEGMERESSGVHVLAPTKEPLSLQVKQNTAADKHSKDGADVPTDVDGYRSVVMWGFG